MSSTSDYEVIVIGGGQAGLAIGHHLARQGRRFTILEAAAAAAAAWRERWDSLRLFTPARYDSLRGMPFPFLGLSWMHTRGSALLGWVGEDAAYIADQIRMHAEGEIGRGS